MLSGVRFQVSANGDAAFGIEDTENKAKSGNNFANIFQWHPHAVGIHVYSG